MDQPISGLILAGGEGRRFGATNKGWATWKGRAFIEHAHANLSRQVSSIIISANRNAERYAAFGDDLVDDGRWLDHGPLAGLYAGLSVCKTEWLAYAPVDALRLPEGWVKALLQAALTQQRPSALAWNGEYPVPTCGLLHQSTLPAVDAALRSDRRALRDLHASLASASVNWPESSYIWSVNSPEELARL